MKTHINSKFVVAAANVVIALVATPLVAPKALGATGDTIITDPDGIAGFELYGNGIYWWDAPGLCEGELPNEATIRVRGGSVFSATKNVLRSCNILQSQVANNVVRNDVVTYFFGNNQLQYKIVGVAESIPPLNLSAVPPLPSGQLGAYLEYHDDILYWSRFRAVDQMVFIWSMYPSGNSPDFVGSIDGGAEVKKMKYFTYTDASENTIAALAVLLDNGRLFRLRLDNGVYTQLASGVSDFAIHTVFSLLGPGITTLYVSRGVATPLPSTPAGSVVRIDPAAASGTVIYTALGRNQVIGIATDSNRGVFSPSKNVYFAESVVSCGQLGCTVSDVVIRRNTLPGTDGTWDLIVHTDGGSNLRSDDEFLYYLEFPSNSVGLPTRIKRISTDAPPIQFDMAAVALEAGQATQDMNGSVRIVAGRASPGYARGYANIVANTTGQSTWLPNARLQIFLNNQELATSPLSPINSTAIDSSSAMSTLRPALNRSFLFELPPLPQGQLTMTFTVNPDATITETGGNPYGNNSLTSPVNVDRTICVNLRMYAMPTGMGTYDPNAFFFWDVIERVKSLLPCQSLSVQFHPANWDGEVFFTQPFGGVNSSDSQDNDALDKIECIREQTSIDGGSQFCNFTHWVGMIHPAVANFGGLGKRPGFSLIAGMLDGGGGFASPGSPGAGLTLAHEMSHNYGRMHVNCCSPNACPSSPDPNYPFNPATIGANSFTGFWGFDFLSKTVLAPGTTADLMSYCNPTWVSRYTWNADWDVYNIAYDNPQPANISPVNEASFSAAPLAVPSVLFVNGFIRPQFNGAAFGAFYQLPSDAVDFRILKEDERESLEAADGRDPYFLWLLDADGHLLGETAIPVQDYSEGPADRLSFAHWVPFDPAASRIQLIRAAQILAERDVTPNAPTLQLGRPTFNSATETVNLNWVASDTDGDPLLFNVHYSWDGGSNWEILRNNYTGLSLVLDSRRLHGGAQVRFRVSATDGVNTTVAATSPLALPQSAPQPSISGIREGQRLEFGAIARLTGGALDAEEDSGSLALMWNLAGPTHRTSADSQLSLMGLSPGLYHAALTATDANSQSATATRNFEVLPLVVPGGAAPKLDGFANDATYTNAALVVMPLGNGESIPVRLLHSGTNLFVVFSDLQRSAVGARRIGIRLDVDASAGSLVAPGDISFFIDQEGIAWQEVASGGSMVVALSPQPGFSATVGLGNSKWSAEFRISDSLLGGWNHAVRIMIDHDTAHWPPLATDNSPASWAPAYLGTTLPALSNRAPVANAGRDQVLNVPFSRRFALEGGASYDPDGDPLSFQWTQASGPIVVLSNAATANPSFLLTPATTQTDLRFRLVVNDGPGNSTPDEVQIRIVPTARAPQTFPPPAFVHDGVFHARFPGEAGRRYSIEATEDFKRWTRIYSNSADASGVIDFIDADLKKYSWRFFRALAE